MQRIIRVGYRRRRVGVLLHRGVTGQLENNHGANAKMEEGKTEGGGLIIMKHKKPTVYRLHANIS